jgi:hypothetical protein
MTHRFLPLLYVIIPQRLSDPSFLIISLSKLHSIVVLQTSPRPRTMRPMLVLRPCQRFHCCGRIRLIVSAFRCCDRPRQSFVRLLGGFLMVGGVGEIVRDFSVFLLFLN